MLDLSHLELDPASELPLYKQIAEGIQQLISSSAIVPGERLPATRELAGQLGLNRTTVSAAYTALEQNGWIEGRVGKGSFVTRRDKRVANSQGTDWEAILPPLQPIARSVHKIEINFANSRPAEGQFPLAAFRRLSKQVIDGPDAAEILQLGSAHGYPPLRRYLLAEAVKAGVARSGDDVMISNGCQQALDLIARLFAGAPSVAVEDPVYHGLLRVLSRTGANILSIPVRENGVDLDTLESVLEQHRPRLLVITPNFQNPTGATLPLEHRKRVVQLAQRFGPVVVESDIYGELRYEGKPLPTLKELDEMGNTILLRSYSKVSFPGLRVGWVIGPRAVIARLAEAKQITDLHSDQLSQAVLLRFAESGELAAHLERTRMAGAERLDAVLRACARELPAGSRYSHPQGGMNLWIELPPPLTAEGLLARAEQHGVSFLPGRYFSTGGRHVRGLRISFGGLSPGQIRRGIQILGDAAKADLAASAGAERLEPLVALV